MIRNFPLSSTLLQHTLDIIGGSVTWGVGAVLVNNPIGFAGGACVGFMIQISDKLRIVQEFRGSPLASTIARISLIALETFGVIALTLGFLQMAGLRSEESLKNIGHLIVGAILGTGVCVFPFVLIKRIIAPEAAYQG